MSLLTAASFNITLSAKQQLSIESEAGSCSDLLLEEDFVGSADLVGHVVLVVPSDRDLWQ